MPIKELTELEWKSFAVKQGVKETALTKALAQLSKAESQGPKAEGDALDAVGKQCGLLIKEHKGNKDVLRRLEGISDAAAKRWQAVEKLIEQAAREEAKGDDDEADSPVLLTTKMVPLLRELRKGEVRMPALICTAGKATALLIMRKPIATARRKLLAEAVDAKGGAKYIAGECLLENGALTFVVQGSAAGLAKRLRQALLDQVQLRLKVRVRGEDGDEDLDGEEEQEGETESEGEGPGMPVDNTRPDKTDTTGTEPDAGARFNARLAALMPRIKDALAAAGPQANDIKLKVSEAGTLARGKQLDAAHAVLDALEPLLERLATDGKGGSKGSGSGDDAAQAVRRAVQAWQEASEAVDAQLSRLQRALKESDDEELVEISNFGLNAVTGNHKVRLMAGLVPLRTAQGDALRAAAARTLPIATGLRRHLDSEPRVEACDENPFGVQVSIRATLGPALDELGEALKAAAA